MDVNTIVALGGITVGVIILGVSAWSLVFAWQHDDVEWRGGIRLGHAG